MLTNEIRPRLSLPLTPVEHRLEWTGRLLLLGLWLALLAGYHWLPARIPTHFGASGRADHFGDRGAILLLPVIATVCFGVLTKLSEYPHTFNYSTPITPTNAEREYRAAGQLVRWLKLAVVVISALVAGFSYQASFATVPQLPGWLLTLTLTLALGPLLGYLFMARRRSIRNA